MPCVQPHMHVGAQRTNSKKALLWSACALVAQLVARGCEAQLSLRPLADNNCSFSYLKVAIPRFNAACCMAGATNICGGKPPTICTSRCANTFIPLYDRCSVRLNLLYDDVDGMIDHNGTIFAELYSKCLRVDPMLLLAKIKLTESSTCHVNVAGILARRPPPSAAVSGCKDNDAGMRAVSSFTCLQVKAQMMCVLIKKKVLPPMCSCSCPASAVGSRRQLRISSGHVVPCPLPALLLHCKPQQSLTPCLARRA